MESLIRSEVLRHREIDRCLLSGRSVAQRFTLRRLFRDLERFSEWLLYYWCYILTPGLFRWCRIAESSKGTTSCNWSNIVDVEWMGLMRGSNDWEDIFFRYISSTRLLEVHVCWRLHGPMPLPSPLCMQVPRLELLPLHDDKGNLDRLSSLNSTTPQPNPIPDLYTGLDQSLILPPVKSTVYRPNHYSNEWFSS